MCETPQESLSILVVEDDPGDFGMVKAFLRQAGLAVSAEPVRWAKTLAEGIASARRSAPDVILLDLSLPDSLGLTTVHAFLAAVPAAPIVVLTGNDEKTLALATLKSGAQDYLVKGQFDQDALGRAVRYALVRGKLEQRLLHHQQHLEEMVKERTIELARALDAAQAASRAKSVFLANMSHEIRTPLNGIMGMTWLLIHNASDRKQIERLTSIDGAAHHLLDILNNVLDMAKIEAGKMILEERAFAPASILHEVFALLDGQANAKGLLLELECDMALPKSLLGDPLRLKQVLINLAGNALEFTERGSITLGARLKSRTGAGAFVEFSVADTGIGIASADIERIFHTFEQADNSNTRAHGGTGLGLAISRNLVNLMGGELEISSVPGHGSTFSFVVGLNIPEPAQQPALDQAVHRPFSLSGARILVAEDDLLNQEIIRELLSNKGMQVELAADGGQAVDLAMSNPYDLILMDLHMPVMNGTDASLCIRQLPQHADTPILALTADVFANTREKCLLAGMNDHIGKPFEVDHLLTSIEYWLNVNHAASRAVGSREPLP